MRRKFRIDRCRTPLSVASRGAVWGVLAITLVVGYTGSRAQNSTLGSPNNPPVNGRVDGERERDAPAISPQMQEQMADRRNSDRQKQLQADTEKLFQLAQQLRDEVAKTNKDQLSIPVVKRSEEIEKLARSIKEKMRGY